MANRPYYDPTTHELLGYYTKVQLQGDETPVMNIADCSLAADAGGQSDKILSTHTAYGNDGRLITGSCDFDVNSSAPISGVQLISDGTKMLAGYGAYAATNAIAGTITTQSDYTIDANAAQDPTTSYAITAGYYPAGTNVVLTNVTSNKIANGQKLFGITGTGGQGSYQTKTISGTLGGGTYNPDQGYDAMSQVVITPISQQTTPNAHGFTLTIG